MLLIKDLFSSILVYFQKQRFTSFVYSYHWKFLLYTLPRENISNKMILTLHPTFGDIDNVKGFHDTMVTQS